VSGAQVCVTNTVRDLRSCVIKGAHRSNCDGYELRYDPETGQTKHHYQIEWNNLTRENDRWLVPCPGCLPRRADRGMLCQAHTLKLDHSLDHDETGQRVLVDLITHLWSIESGGIRDDNDRVSTAKGSQWPLSASHLSANEIYTYLASTCIAFANDLRIPEPEFSAAASILDGFLNDMDVDIVGVLTRRLLEYIEENQAAAVKHKHSAETVVRMIGVIQTAMAKFPLVDLEHRVPFVRCAACSRMTLTWKPPLMNADDVVVKCERCGHEENQDWLEAYIEVVKTDKRRKTA